jgi:hypothetical protein
MKPIHHPVDGTLVIGKTDAEVAKPEPVAP